VVLARSRGLSSLFFLRIGLSSQESVAAYTGELHPSIDLTPVARESKTPRVSNAIVESTKEYSLVLDAFPWYQSLESGHILFSDSDVRMIILLVQTREDA
jgi:hypothetical protein